MRSAVRPPAIAAVLCAALLPAVTTRASLPILGGDLLTLRDGNGTTDTTASTAASAFIDQFRNTAGTWSLVQSFPLPSSGPNALTIDFTNPTEGGINVSTDGNYLTFAGYRQNAGTNPGSAPSLQDPAVVPRVVGVLSLATGEVDTSTVLRTDSTAPANLFYKGPVRDVVSTDGNHFWVAGSTAATASIPTGLVYVPDLGSGVTSIVLNSQILNAVSIVGGNLYTNSVGSLRKVVPSTGTGLPTEPPTTETPLTSVLPTAGENPLLFDLNPAVPGPDTLYVGDGSSSLRKYSLVAGSWTQVGSINTGTVSPFHLAGLQTGAGVTLYYASNPNPSLPSLVGTLTDTAGYNAPFAASPSTLLTAPTNTSFHGLAIVPTPGDVTNDFVLNADDYAVLDRFVAKNGLGAPTDRRIDGDLNNDGTVDAADYLLIDQAFFSQAQGFSPGFLTQRESQFGAPYVAQLLAAVPEPTTLTLLAATLAAVTRRTRGRRE